METRALALVAVTVLAGIVSAGARPDETLLPAKSEPIKDLCKSSICECNTEAIKCTCKNKENIEVKVDAIEANTNPKNLEVEDCNSLTIADGDLEKTLHLTKLQVTNVTTVKIEKVFKSLETVTINLVSTLKLGKNVFDGAKGLKQITISNSGINELEPETLHFSRENLSTLELNNVTIQEVKKNAFKIEGSIEGSSVKISDCKIHTIEEQGMDINFPNINLINTEIRKANEKSIILKCTKSLEIRGNTFKSEVHVKSFEITSSKTDFINNILENIDNSHLTSTKSEGPLTLGILVSSKEGNTINCRCDNFPKLEENVLKNTFCVGGCKGATLKVLEKECVDSKDPSPNKDKNIIKKVCDTSKSGGEIVPTANPPSVTNATTVRATNATTPSEDGKPESEQKAPRANDKDKSLGSKNYAQILPLFAVYLFRLLL